MPMSKIAWRRQYVRQRKELEDIMKIVMEKNRTRRENHETRYIILALKPE